MKPKSIVPFLLVAFLAGSSIAYGQDSNEKKIQRLKHKIEKQSKKLHELTGEDKIVIGHISPSIRAEEIAKIKDEARAQADEARKQATEARAQAGEIRARVRGSIDQQREMGQQLKEMKEFEIQKNINGKKYSYYYNTPKFEYRAGNPVVIDVPDIKVDIPEFKNQVYTAFMGNQNNLSINKILKDETSSADFNYEVKKGTPGVSINVNGSIDSGKVIVTIKQPNGDVYNEYTLSPLANVTWRQSVDFDDKEETTYVGKWAVTVTAENAKGNYSVKISER